MIVIGSVAKAKANFLGSWFRLSSLPLSFIIPFGSSNIVPSGGFIARQALRCGTLDL
jgi:hypothetical protein